MLIAGVGTELPPPPPPPPVDGVVTVAPVPVELLVAVDPPGTC